MLKRLLIVDDEPTILKVLARFFIDHGFEVETAQGPLAALEQLKQKAFAIILSDYRMPQMSGLEFLKNARQINPQTVRIMMSGYADTQVSIACLNEELTYRFLTKPWDDNHLLSSVLEAFSHFKEKTRGQTFDQNPTSLEANTGLATAIATPQAQPQAQHHLTSPPANQASPAVSGTGATTGSTTGATTGTNPLSSPMGKPPGVSNETSPGNIKPTTQNSLSLKGEQLMAGMVLAAPIETLKGVIFFEAGHRLQTADLTQLRAHFKTDPPVEPIWAKKQF